MPDNSRRLRPRLLAFVLVSLLPSPYLAAQSAPGEIVGHKIKVPGDKVEGTTARLSEVEAEMVAALPPQQQAERLLQYAISHHVGATDEIKARVKGWLGQIKQTPALDTLVEVATNGDDLRVRAAAWEVQLAALNLAKTTAAGGGAACDRSSRTPVRRCTKSGAWGSSRIEASRPRGSTTSFAC